MEIFILVKQVPDLGVQIRRARVDGTLELPKNGLEMDMRKELIQASIPMDFVSLPFQG